MPRKFSVDSHTLARALVLSIRKHRRELEALPELTPAQRRQLARIRGIIEWSAWKDGKWNGRN